MLLSFLKQVNNARKLQSEWIKTYQQRKVGQNSFTVVLIIILLILMLDGAKGFRL